MVGSRTVVAATAAAALVPLMMCAAPAPAVAPAHHPGAAAYDLGVVVVTDREAAHHATTTVHTITAAQIGQLRPTSVAEILTTVPGLHVRHGGSQEAYVRVRGFRQREVLILINGMPIESAYSGQTNLDMVPVELVQRIEIVKGAASSLYGPNTIAGVVNIITRKAGDKMSGTAEARFTEPKNVYTAAGLSGAHGPFNYFVSANRLDAAGYRLSGDFTPTTLQDEGRRDNSDRERSGLFLNLGFEPDERTAFGVTFLGRQAQFGIPPLVADGKGLNLSSPKYERQDDFDSGQVQLAGRRRCTDRLTLRAAVFGLRERTETTRYDDETYSTMLQDGSGPEQAEDRAWGGHLFADLDLAPYGLFSVGGGWRRNNRVTDGYVQAKNKKTKVVAPVWFDTELQTDTYYAAAEYQVTLGENLTIVPGVCVAQFDKYEGENRTTGAALAPGDDAREWCPQLGLSYQLLPATRLFGSVAKKVRFPLLRELYETKVKNNQQVGDADLRPQKSVNSEIGLEQVFGRTLVLRVTCFHQDIEGFIEKDATDVYVNTPDVSSAGVETELELRPVHGFSCRLNYTWLSMLDKSGSRNEVQYRPEHKVSWCAEYRFPTRTRVTLNGSWVGRQFHYDKNQVVKFSLDAYTLVNLQVSQEVGEHAEIFAGIDNLLDTDYEESYALPRAGRSAFVGGRVRF